MELADPSLDIVKDWTEGSALIDNPIVVYTSDAQRNNPPYCGISGEKESNLASMVTNIIKKYVAFIFNLHQLRR